MLYKSDLAVADTNSPVLASVPRMPDEKQLFSLTPSALFLRALAVAIFPSG
jgi:hypothetical protein